jgi:hypothetical protein
MVVSAGAFELLVPRGTVAPAIGELAGLATANGGFVEGSGTSPSASGQPPSGHTILRVPGANFETVVQQVENDTQWSTTAVTTSGRDVTPQDLDLQAQIRSLQSVLGRDEQVLSRAQTPAGAISVEKQIARLQTQIQPLEGQLQALEDKVAYATLTVDIVEAPAARP